MAARGHMNGWPAVGGTGWSAQRGSLQYKYSAMESILKKATENIQSPLFIYS